MPVPGDLINITQDMAGTAYGVPTLKQRWVGIIVFLAVLLIWVGASLIFGRLFTQSGSNRSGYGHGGIVGAVGISILIVAKTIDYYKS